MRNVRYPCDTTGFWPMMIATRGEFSGSHTGCRSAANPVTNSAALNAGKMSTDAAVYACFVPSLPKKRRSANVPALSGNCPVAL
ncbi:MAG: hypothetical protein E6G39_00730 [Actinobacteria bacterium]|nr:MAG: hypothetical protein E6G39_00730 [Actinomycetota bacterium]